MRLYCRLQELLFHISSRKKPFITNSAMTGYHIKCILISEMLNVENSVLESVKQGTCLRNFYGTCKEDQMVKQILLSSDSVSGSHTFPPFTFDFLVFFFLIQYPILDSYHMCSA